MSEIIFIRIQGKPTRKICPHFVIHSEFCGISYFITCLRNMILLLNSYDNNIKIRNTIIVKIVAEMVADGESTEDITTRLKNS